MDRPWLKLYPSGMPANINADAYTRLIDMVEECFQKYSDRPAFTCMGKTLTYRQVDEMSNAFGAYLQSRGLEPGDRIALMMPNLLQYPIAMFGALRAGLVIVNTNPLYTPREMKHQFIDSGVKAILVAENFAANLEQVISETSINTVILTSIGEMLGLKGVVVNFVLRRVKKMIPKYLLANTVTFKQAIQAGKKFSIKHPGGQSDDTIILQYTGGTTGVSKGAMLTNRNLVSNMQQIRSVMQPLIDEGKQDIAFCPLPMYHIFAFTVNCLSVMYGGGHSILIVNPRDIAALIKEWNLYNPSITTGLNTLFNGILNHPDFPKMDCSNLKISSAGGMAMQRAVGERWQKSTGCQITEGYGMTESSPVITSNPVIGSRLGTIGMPVPSTDVRIVDEAGNVLPPGSENIGEIQAKGPQVMKGYWQRPDATAEVINDGWLSTGDIGFMHPDGFFQIVDRKKDMILVSGFNVYPNEIEDVIAMHPKVLEVVAVGIPDEKSGEVPKVFIVKKDQSLTSEEILEHCRANLTGYKMPRKIEFRTDLPKTNVGKILRRVLRDEANAK